MGPAGQSSGKLPLQQANFTRFASLALMLVILPRPQLDLLSVRSCSGEFHMTAGQPSQPGFYWATWTSAGPGTREGPVAGEGWIVVQVFENANPSEADHLRVLVPGVEAGQSVEDFVWGHGPL